MQNVECGMQNLEHRIQNKCRVQNRDFRVYTNYKVNPHYDSLILKLISRGENRDEAISIMYRALNEIIIEGIDTNIDLHKWILKQDIFTSGQYNTNWLEKNIVNFQQNKILNSLHKFYLSKDLIHL